MKLHLAVLMFLVTPLFAKVTGATIESVTMEGREATITILNQSDKDIAQYDLDVILHFEDGHEMHSGHGATSAGIPLIKAHQVKIETENFRDWDHLPTKIDAVLLYIVYMDGTAEGSEDQNSGLDETIALNNRHAETVKLLASELNAALSDVSPIASAHARLENAIARKDQTVDNKELETVYKDLLHAPQDKELKLLREQAAHYSQEQKSIAARPQLRRVQ